MITTKFVLFNPTNRRYLTHPRLGMWSTVSSEEANGMLEAAVAYKPDDGITLKEVPLEFYSEEEPLLEESF